MNTITNKQTEDDAANSKEYVYDYDQLLQQIWKNMRGN